MHKEDIKAALRKGGLTLTAIAVELDIQQSTVSAVLYGRRSRRIEAAIAHKLNRSLFEVFPDRYEREEVRDELA